jgi:hypothetical protein
VSPPGLHRTRPYSFRWDHHIAHLDKRRWVIEDAAFNAARIPGSFHVVPFSMSPSSRPSTSTKNRLPVTKARMRS